MYSKIYVTKILGILIGLPATVAIETMVLGFCLQICARFEILLHRLQKMIKHDEKEAIPTNWLNKTSNKISKLSEHVIHHLCIIRLAEMINDVFSQIIFVQFFTSTFVICLTIFYLSSHMTIENLSTYSVYVICTFVQIFMYCWAGNQVTTKSTELGEEIFNMDWISMTKNEQRDLLMIMMRSTIPIKFTSTFLVTLSLEAYGNLLKTSFSAFNLLQQVQK
ncbi:putative odorant receptor 85d isoform X2 [Solenopsis invicta]|uniref:putative odorant receptor 85d isoform X2 n=1 Tax=Solenopsis invicta TaxID=13686 RepID=UPI00193DFEAC|nr:putative odorant receptor 85d isoform X2 [Solenopsis invicta]